MLKFLYGTSFAYLVLLFECFVIVLSYANYLIDQSSKEVDTVSIKEIPGPKLTTCDIHKKVR